MISPAAEDRLFRVLRLAILFCFAGVGAMYAGAPSEPRVGVACSVTSEGGSCTFANRSPREASACARVHLTARIHREVCSGVIPSKQSRDVSTHFTAAEVQRACELLVSGRRRCDAHVGNETVSEVGFLLWLLWARWILVGLGALAAIASMVLWQRRLRRLIRTPGGQSE